MDGVRFDAVLRSLSGGASRRGMLAGLSAGLLVALPGALRIEEAAAKKKKKKRGGRRRAPECSVDTDCPTDNNGQCLCDLEGLCFTNTGGFIDTSCAQCPAGTVECDRVSGGFSCFARCGA